MTEASQAGAEEATSSIASINLISQTVLGSANWGWKRPMGTSIRPLERDDVEYPRPAEVPLRSKEIPCGPKGVAGCASQVAKVALARVPPPPLVTYQAALAPPAGSASGYRTCSSWRLVRRASVRAVNSGSSTTSNRRPRVSSMSGKLTGPQTLRWKSLL